MHFSSSSRRAANAADAAAATLSTVAVAPCPGTTRTAFTPPSC